LFAPGIFYFLRFQIKIAFNLKKNFILDFKFYE
jgi:hypothetical protein